MTKRETAWQPAQTEVTATKTPLIRNGLRPLTPKQRAFVKHLIDNPKSSATAAIKATYGKPHKPVGDGTARMMGSENLAKPSIALELAKHSGEAELVQVKLMNTSSKYSEKFSREGASYAAVALATSQAILDRVHGKATQRIEQSTTAVTLNIDLTGATTSVDVPLISPTA